MIIGQTICAKDEATTTVYTPWFPRAGEVCVSVFDLIAIGDASVTITMQTKNSEALDTAATSMGNKTTTTLGRNSWDCENALELVRYKIEVTGTSPQTSVRGGRVGIFGGYVRAPGSTDSVERLSSGR